MVIIIIIYFLTSADSNTTTAMFWKGIRSWANSSTSSAVIKVSQSEKYAEDDMVFPLKIF